MNIFFSVIIPTFNQADYLNKCLKSVLNQTFRNFEVIVIDNFSQDDTSKVINNFKNKIIYKKFKNNGVIAKSRNLGIRIAKGKWISFLDSDDEWIKNKLEITYNKINENNKIDVICNDEWIVKNLNFLKKKIWSYGPYEKNFYKKLILFGNRNSTSATSVKKEFLINNNISFNEKREFVTAEDYEFFLQIASKNGIFYYLNIPLGLHLFHEKSESSNLNKLFKAHEKVLDYHIQNCQNFSKKKLRKKIKFLNKIKFLLFFNKNNNVFYKFSYIFFLILNIPLTSFFFFIFLIKKSIRQYKILKKYKLKL